MAAGDTDPELKPDFERQAQAYHNLAGKRARELGLPLPTDKIQTDTLAARTSSRRARASR
jgi:hypothetical protein